jgi:dolichol-phosphate mannosyltransferase
MRKLIVLPSYNESDNIIQLIEAIRKVDPENSVCVVDDNSPDKTSEKVKAYIDKNAAQFTDSSSVHLIVRLKKDGRGGAVREGIQWGIGKNFDVFVEMDCDFSHPPDSIPKGYQMLGSADVVLGSRYPDGKIIGWPIHRRVLSFCANLLARILISWQICDFTNGFRFYNRKAAALMVKMPQKNKGYIYLSETLSYFLTQKFVIKSFPIIFVNRVRGVSNTSINEVLSALTGIVSIAWNYRTSSKP